MEEDPDLCGSLRRGFAGAAARAGEGCRVVTPCPIVLAAAGDAICGGKGQAEGGQDAQGFTEFGAVMTCFQIDEEFP